VFERGAFERAAEGELGVSMGSEGDNERAERGRIGRCGRRGGFSLLGCVQQVV
jgi:hypothetical protein